MLGHDREPTAAAESHAENSDSPAAAAATIGVGLAIGCPLRDVDARLPLGPVDANDYLYGVVYHRHPRRPPRAPRSNVANATFLGATVTSR
jgi:hypothetical protein